MSTLFGFALFLLRSFLLGLFDEDVSPLFEQARMLVV